ncbi:MAG: HupE/UreJ family protein [Pseudomonadota bacterium]|nr:HupE/UreJ family protein [Pseudomonadota bacterium]
MRLLRILTLLVLLIAPLPSQAHPLAPALLDLREIATHDYDAHWRTSVLRVRGGELTPQWPQDCKATEQGTPQYFNDEAAVEQRWRLRCANALPGQLMQIRGLSGSGINVILNLRLADGSTAQTLLGSGDTSFVVPQAEMQPPVFQHYMTLGIEHLLFGFDHVLFVLGLLLLVRRPSTLLLTVTAFTLGHSCTLALAALGLINVNPALTELAIAISILLLAVTVVRPANAPPTLLSRWPALMAAAFGLLHGLGFAGALAGIGLPQDEIPLALLAFNVGIEAGQLLLIAAALVLAALWRRVSVSQPSGTVLLRLLPSYLMGTLAAYWCMHRAAAVWS